MANKVNINEGRELLVPVVNAYAERIRIGEPTHRDRLMAWVARNMGELLDEAQALRDECHGRRFDPNLVAENKQLRSELAEAHEALTAAMAQLDVERQRCEVDKDALRRNHRFQCDRANEALAEVARLRGLVEKTCDVLAGAEEGEAEYDGVKCEHYAARIREEVDRG